MRQSGSYLSEMCANDLELFRGKGKPSYISSGNCSNDPKYESHVNSANFYLQDP